jgi:hypothetical protein
LLRPKVMSFDAFVPRPDLILRDIQSLSQVAEF